MNCGALSPTQGFNSSAAFQLILMGFNMKIIKILAIIVLPGLIVASCTTTYPRPKFIDFPKTPEPLKLLKEFRKNQIVSCTMAQNAVLDLNGKSMAAIGLCAFDNSRGYLAVSLISTTGIKLIEVAEFNGKRRSVFAISDISNEEKAADRIADDVKRIYTHPKGNPLYYQCNSNKVVFIWPTGKIKNELSLGYNPQSGKVVLKEKKIFVDNVLEGCVFYYDYQDFKGKDIPMRIRYENYKYGYSLTLKNTEVVEGGQYNKK